MNQQSQIQQQKESYPDNDFPIKAWLLRKTGQYIDGVLINGLSALVFGGVLWFLQRFWGLRLIPFSVLDAILLALGLTVVVIILIALIVFLILHRFLKKYPAVAFGLVVGLFVALLASYYVAKQEQQKDGETKNPSFTLRL